MRNCDRGASRIPCKSQPKMGATSMKKSFLSLLLCLILSLFALGAAAEESYEAHWYDTSDTMQTGTLQEALTAAQTGNLYEHNKAIFIVSDIEDAAYVINNGKFNIYCHNGAHTITAKEGSSAFTIAGDANVWFSPYDYTIKGSEACFTVEDNAHFTLSNNSYYDGTLAAADGKPAIIFDGKYLQLYSGATIRYSNTQNAYDLEYRGGVVWHPDHMGIKVYNASGETIPVGSDSWELFANSYLLSKKGEKVTQMAPGEIYTLDARFSVTLDPGDYGTGTPVTFAEDLKPYTRFTLPECPFASSNPDMVFAGWQNVYDETVYLPGDSCKLTESAMFEAQWSVPVAIDGFPLLDGQYMIPGGEPVSGDPSGKASYAYLKNGILTLHNFNGKKLMLSGSVTVRLEGENRFTNNNTDEDWSDALILDCANAVITAADAESKLILQSQHGDGIGESSGGRLTINGGTLDITADDDGIDTEGSLILNGGNIIIRADDNGITCEETVTINGGKLLMEECGDDGIDADEGLTVNSGVIDITAKDNGLDSNEGDIVINGGDITLTAKDYYGISAGDVYEPQDIRINGGKLNITAKRFGLLAYGDLIVNGGSGVITVTSADGLTAAAMGQLKGEVFSNRVRVDVYDGYFEDPINVETVASEEGLPLKAFSYDLSSPSQPKTGDSTPLALLALTMALSLCGVLMARRRA